MNSIRRWSNRFSLLVCAGLLCACQSTGYYDEDDTFMLPTKIDGASDAEIIKKQIQFNAKCISVVTMGQDYMITIPSTALFADESPRLKWRSYEVLNEVASFLKQFRKVAIHVGSYSSHFVSAKREHALTIARARSVGDYLWSQGVDSRLIFADGYGSDKPITVCCGGGDGSPNSRIEITFRQGIV